jgi:hypothetical protein
MVSGILGFLSFFTGVMLFTLITVIREKNCVSSTSLNRKTLEGNPLKNGFNSPSESVFASVIVLLGDNTSAISRRRD